MPKILKRGGYNKIKDVFGHSAVSIIRSYKLKKMFNLFKNTTEDFPTFTNEEIAEITKDEARRASKSEVTPIKIEAQPPFLYPPFTQEEVDCFLKKVDLVK